MDLHLARTVFSDQSTIGELTVNGTFECFTLEDVVRAVKLAGVTAIPSGNYEVVITFSERFQRPVPLLLKVPDFDGIRIHWGNTDENTDGCILVGQTKAKDFIGRSRAAFDALFPKLQAAAQSEKIFIAVTNAASPVSPGAMPAGAAAGSTKEAAKPGEAKAAKLGKAKAGKRS
jgi:hypothetical protein